MSTLRRKLSNWSKTGKIETRLLDSRIRMWQVWLVTMLFLSWFHLASHPWLGTWETFLAYAPVVAILIGVRWTKPELRTPWYLFALGQFFYATGDLLAYNYSSFFGFELTFPAWSDAFYLMMYPALLYGGVLLIERVPKDNLHHVRSDILIVVAIAAAVIAIFTAPALLGPSFDYHWLIILYPVLDFIFLAILIEVRLHPSPVTYYVLLVGVFSLFLTDTIYAYGTINHTLSLDYTGTNLDIGWMVFYACLGAAALTKNGERPFVPEREEAKEDE